MTAHVPIRSISGNTEVAGALRSRLLRLPVRSLFPMTLQNPELLPRAGADCPARRRLTKTKEEETIIINRSGRPTYPEEKSVSRSGATPKEQGTQWVAAGTKQVSLQVAKTITTAPIVRFYSSD